MGTKRTHEGLLIAECTSTPTYAHYRLHPVVFEAEVDGKGYLLLPDAPLSILPISGERGDWDPFRDVLPGTGSLRYDYFAFVDFRDGSVREFHGGTEWSEAAPAGAWTARQLADAYPEAADYVHAAWARAQGAMEAPSAGAQSPGPGVS